MNAASIPATEAPGDFDWSQYGGTPGGRVNMDDLNEMFGGGGFSDFFQSIFGMGGARAAAHSRPQGYQQELEITLEEAYKGTTRRIQTDGSEKSVRIPAGVRTGSKVRVAGAGPNGLDLYLIVQVADHKHFERQGNDLHTTATVNVFTVLLGGEAEVETLEGKIKLNIPAGTQPEQVFPLAGRGMPHVRDQKDKGGPAGLCRVWPRRLHRRRDPGTIGFATVRGGDIVGDHTVMFCGTGERIETTHRSASRETYAQGSLRAARFLADKPHGLFGMEHVLGLS